jgi:hypothetical protein
MKLYKTDRRFSLYYHGFENYLKCTNNDIYLYYVYLNKLKELFGDSAIFVNKKIYNENAKYCIERKGRKVFLKNEKIYTILLMTITDKDKDVFNL